MIRAIVFDFDGLIVDSESALIRSYEDIHAAHDRPFDEAFYLRAVGQSDCAIDPWLSFGGGVDRAALEAERRARNRAREDDLLPLPGVVALLDAARAAGLHIALASNSDHDHCERHLDRIGLLDRFAFLACREDVQFPKPEPDLYELVLRHFGLRGCEAVALEDSCTGSLAAKRANMYCVVIPNPVTANHDFAHADRQVNSMREISIADLVTLHHQNG